MATLNANDLDAWQTQLWQNWLSRFLANQNHRGPHVWRRIPDPLDPRNRIVGCWKCGKAKPE